MNRTKYDRERLLFRRQFILGPRFLDGFPTWKRLSVRPTMRLTVHPDLPTEQAWSGSKSVVLLGYILDPQEPRASSADVVKRLLADLETGATSEAIIKSTHPLGGRWILLVDNGKTVSLFNDPAGYRGIFYARLPSRGLWCASQPGLLAEVLGLTVDPRALSFQRAYRRVQRQYWWPGDSSLYKEVHHLLPNHFLDLETGAASRFWPDRELPVRTLEEVVEENASLLQRLLESASHRFELALSITAGKDTRLLLAASKAIRQNLYCFTMMYWDLTRDSPDIRIPSLLLSKLGIAHHVIPCPSRMDREFREIYRRNVTTAHDLYGKIAQGLYNHYPTERVNMKGNAVPITICPYRHRLRRWRKGADKDITTRTLAWLMKIPEEQDFGLEALDRWLSEAARTEVNVLDLFFWENREGNWQAMSQSEWDIVQETFVPFNCRLFLVNMLSVPEPLREMPTYTLEATLIHRLWPEVLSEPINPPVTPTMLSTVREFLKNPDHKDMDWLYSRSIGPWRERER